MKIKPPPIITQKVLPIGTGLLVIGFLASGIVTNPGVSVKPNPKPIAKSAELILIEPEPFKLATVDLDYSAPSVRGGNTIEVEAKESTSSSSQSSEVGSSSSEQKTTADITVDRFGKSLTIKKEVVEPVLAKRNSGKISTHTASMILSLHVIESPHSGWGALGCNVNNTTGTGCANGEGGRGYGRFGVGLLQVMSFPEFGMANKASNTNWTIQEVLKDPEKQLDIIVGLMKIKTGETTGKGFLDNNYNESQMSGLAGSWLGQGCDKHGTCTDVYQAEAIKNYKTIYNLIK